MVLAGSLEFEKSHNNEVQERASDNVELPQVFWSNSVVTIKKNFHLVICFVCVKEGTYSQASIVRRVFAGMLLGLGIFLIDSYRWPYNFAN